MILFILGSLLILISSVGVVMQKDVLSRASAASVGTGLGVLLIGVGALSFESISGEWWKIAVILISIFLGAPTAWQVLGRGVLLEKELDPDTKFHMDSQKKESLTE